MESEWGIDFDEAFNYYNGLMTEDLITIEAGLAATERVLVLSNDPDKKLDRVRARLLIVRQIIDARLKFIMG